MPSKQEIREGIAYDISCIVDCRLCKSACLDNDKLYCPEAYRVAGEILEREAGLGVVIKVDRELQIISRQRAESAVGKTDCGEREYTPIEKEDNIRLVLFGAEIQRDKDKYDSGYVAVASLIED